MTQTIGAWNARLWIHYRNRTLMDGNVPIFTGHLEVDDERVHPEGEMMMAGNLLKLKDSSISIPVATETMAAACEGVQLRRIIEIPPCGVPEIDTAADEALITSARRDKDATVLTYANRRFDWQKIIERKAA